MDAVPGVSYIERYVELLLDSPSFFIMFWNSAAITGGILIGQLLTGVTAAWGFARYEFAGKRVLFTIYIALMMMPFQVTMLSSYLILSNWGFSIPTGR